MKKQVQSLRRVFLFSLCAILLAFTAQAAAFHLPVQAKVVRAKIVRKRKVVAAPVPSAPIATLTYNSRRHLFSLRVTWVKKINYTVAYNKKGSDIMEALQGARRFIKATTFTRNIFAGSQSSRYFIPHFVTGGTLEVHGTDWQDNPFTITQSFTISGGKLVVTGP